MDLKVSHECDRNGLCPTWRVKRVGHTTLDRVADGLPPLSFETVLERCGVPLFSFNTAAKCRSCIAGWSVEGNRPATEDELRAAGVT